MFAPDMSCSTDRCLGGLVASETPQPAGCKFCQLISIWKRAVSHQQVIAKASRAVLIGTTVARDAISVSLGRAAVSMGKMNP